MTISGVNSSNVSSLTAMRPPKPPSEAEMFKKDDENGDGVIDKVELSKVASKIQEHTGNTIDVEELMKEGDQDQDGVLSETEMKTVMSKLREKMGPPPGGGMRPMGEVGGMGGGMPSLLDSLNSSSEEEETTLLDLLKASTEESNTDISSLTDLFKSLSSDNTSASSAYKLLSDYFNLNAQSTVEVEG